MAAQATCIARRPLARHIDAQEGKEHNSLAKLRDEAKKWGYSRCANGGVADRLNAPEIDETPHRVGIQQLHPDLIAHIQTSLAAHQSAFHRRRQGPHERAL